MSLHFNDAVGYRGIDKKFGLCTRSMGLSGGISCFLLIVSILVLLFCIFTLNDKFSSLLTRKFYICTTLVLITMIIIFPRASVMFEASSQIMAVWGCIAISLYGLSRYACPIKAVPTQKGIFTPKIKQILAIIGVVFCLILIWMISPFDFHELLVIYFVFPPIVAILILCFCIFTLNDKLSGFIIRNIRICITLALITMIAMTAMTDVFQVTFGTLGTLKSLEGLGALVCIVAVPYLLFYYFIPDSEADLPKKQRVLNNMLLFSFRLTLCTIVYLFHSLFMFNNTHVKGTFRILIIIAGIAAILYSLSRYVNPAKVVAEISEKQRILRYMLRFCIVLAIWVFLCPLYINLNRRVEMYSDIHKGNLFQKNYTDYAITAYHRIHPGWTSEFSPEEAVDITDRIVNVETFIRNGLLKYVNTGAISIILKNDKYISQINVEAWRYSERGVRSFPWWVFEESLEDYKKDLAKDKRNYNSLNLDSPYDGTGSVFFMEAVR